MLSHRNPKPGNRLPSHALGIHTQWLKRDSDKGELLQLPKEAFEVLQPCHIMTAISSEWGSEIKTKRQHMSSAAGRNEPSSGGHLALTQSLRKWKQEDLNTVTFANLPQGNSPRLCSVNAMRFIPVLKIPMTDRHRVKTLAEFYEDTPTFLDIFNSKMCLQPKSTHFELSLQVGTRVNSQ